jgi:hypothetical protein
MALNDDKFFKCEINCFMRFVLFIRLAIHQEERAEENEGAERFHVIE